jgi:hypothetical protein
MVDFASLTKKTTGALLPLLRVGLGAFGKGLLFGLLLTLAAMLLAGYFGSHHGEFLPRLVASLVVGFIGTIATVTLASKRAVFTVVEAALEKLGLGSALFQLVFQHLLGVTDATERGERMGAVRQAVETRLPLAQAEQRLSNAVAKVTLERSEVTGLRGWLLRSVRIRLLGLVATVTLARFREEGQQHGAVDLVRVRDALGQSLDALLVEQVGDISARSTWILGGAAAALSALVTWGVYWGM